LVVFHPDSQLGVIRTQEASVVATADQSAPSGAYKIEILGNAAKMSNNDAVELVVFQQ
jgi:hypothetical protein